MKNNILVKATITGLVQGVFFRACTKDAAIKYGLTGTVKNCVDGSVEAVFQGSQDQVDQMVAWCYSGSPGSKVSQVIVNILSDPADFISFDILY